MSDEFDDLIEQAERREERNKKIEKVGGIIFIVVIWIFVLNMFFSNFVYSISNPKKTRTEIFLRTFKTMTWDMEDDSLQEKSK